MEIQIYHDTDKKGKKTVVAKQGDYQVQIPDLKDNVLAEKIEQYSFPEDNYYGFVDSGVLENLFPDMVDSKLNYFHVLIGNKSIRLRKKSTQKIATQDQHQNDQTETSYLTCHYCGQYVLKKCIYPQPFPRQIVQFACAQCVTRNMLMHVTAHAQSLQTFPESLSNKSTQFELTKYTPREWLQSKIDYNELHKSNHHALMFFQHHMMEKLVSTEETQHLFLNFERQADFHDYVQEEFRKKKQMADIACDALNITDDIIQTWKGNSGGDFASTMSNLQILAEFENAHDIVKQGLHLILLNDSNDNVWQEETLFFSRVFHLFKVWITTDLTSYQKLNLTFKAVYDNYLRELPQPMSMNQQLVAAPSQYRETNLIEGTAYSHDEWTMISWLWWKQFNFAFEDGNRELDRFILNFYSVVDDAAKAAQHSGAAEVAGPLYNLKYTHDDRHTTSPEPYISHITQLICNKLWNITFLNDNQTYIPRVLEHLVSAFMCFITENRNMYDKDEDYYAPEALEETKAKAKAKTEAKAEAKAKAEAEAAGSSSSGGGAAAASAAAALETDQSGSSSERFLYG